jgi:hypothetical protein
MKTTTVPPTTVRITADKSNDDWLIVDDNESAQTYLLKPGQSAELLCRPGIVVVGRSGNQRYACEYLVP